MKNVHRTLTTTVAVILCATFTASGRQPAPTSTVDTLPQQTVSAPSQPSEPTPTVDSSLSQPIEQVAIHKLNTIAQDLSDTKENTNPLITPDCWKTIAGFSLFIGILGFIVSVVNAYQQWRTQRNTGRLTLKKQQGILIDMVRHLYRNLVVTRTIETKMRALDFQSYPSEEHLVKLQIPLEQIKLDSFLNTKFTELSNLYTLFRNYNEEVLIIKDHFKNPALNREAKERDLETLTFKCGLLASKIFFFLIDTPKKQGKKELEDRQHRDINYQDRQPQNNKFRDATRCDIVREIKQSQKDNVEKNFGNAIAPEIEKAIVPYENEKDHFMEIFDSEEQKREFWEGLNRDIRIECGNKQKAEEIQKSNYDYTTDKIYMIKLQTADRRNE